MVEELRPCLQSILDQHVSCYASAVESGDLTQEQAVWLASRNISQAQQANVDLSNLTLSIAAQQSNLSLGNPT